MEKEAQNKNPIYLDYAATTPVAPEVADEMWPNFTEQFGNAASRTHPFGWEAEDTVNQAKDRILGLINGTERQEIVFTSGATESDNLAIKGVFEQLKEKGKHISRSPRNTRRSWTPVNIWKERRGQKSPTFRSIRMN